MLTTTFAIQDSGGAAAAILTIFAAFVGFLACVFFAIFLVHAFICYCLYGALNALPPEHQRQSPGLVWLLMIPFVHFVFNFFVFPRISDSYKSYFESKGDLSNGDCSKGIGIGYSVCCVVFWIPIPIIQPLVCIAALVLLIIYMVKITGLKSQVIESDALPPRPQ